MNFTPQSLEGSPLPHYLHPETVQIAEHREGIITATGKIMFPASDPTVATRGNHANACHAQYSVWNLAALLRDRFPHPRILTATYQALKEMKPDTEYTLHTSIQANVERLDSIRLLGHIAAQVHNSIGTVFFKMDGTFCYIEKPK